MGKSYKSEKNYSRDNETCSEYKRKKRRMKDYEDCDDYSQNYKIKGVRKNEY